MDKGFLMQRHENFDGFEFDANRATPHFSDARVIQEARAVVPLVETENRSKKKSRFFLTGAFAAAMLLGAAVALIAARLERQRFQEAVVNVSKVETTNQPVTPEQQEGQPAEKRDEEGAQPEEPEVTEPDESAAQSSSDPVELEEKPARTVSKKPAEPVSRPHHSDQAVANDPAANDSAEPIGDPSDDDTEKNTQPVLVDQWQERRLRRIEKLDRRARRAAQRRDLMRIDEIFEGSHRPQQ
jgi:hypothetical protein